MKRAYTVAELDALRRACDNKWLFGRYSPSSGCSRSYKDADKAVAVEQMVRTHMLAGHTAADLYASEPPRDTSRDIKFTWPTEEELASADERPQDQDPKGLEAKPASAVGAAETPKTPLSHAEAKQPALSTGQPLSKGAGPVKAAPSDQ